MKKVVIITGASSGIGLATANYLVDKGFTVYGISLSNFQTEKFKHYSCDVCNKHGIEEIFEDIHKNEGRIDVVINNAGMGISGAIEYATENDIRKIFDINIIAMINICSIAVKYLRETQGKIINISSVAGVISIPFQACYSSTKFAVEGFSLALSNEVRPQNIKVTCVRPGDTKTGFTSARIKNEQGDEIYKERVKNSVKKMEKDEQNGAAPISVSKVIYKVIKRKNPPLVCAVGFGYKTICFLAKFLPKKLINYIVYKMY